MKAESRPFAGNASPAGAGQLHWPPCSQAHSTAFGETASSSSPRGRHLLLSASSPHAQAQPKPQTSPDTPVPAQSSAQSSTLVVQARTRDTNTSPGTPLPRDHGHSHASQPLDKNHSRCRAEQPETDAACLQPGEPGEGSGRAPPRRGQQRPFPASHKGHAAQVNTPQLSILPVNASCGAILVTCRGRAGLLHRHQRASVNPTRRSQAPRDPCSSPRASQALELSPQVSPVAHQEM